MNHLIVKRTFLMTALFLMSGIARSSTADNSTQGNPWGDNPLIPRIVMHYVIHCESNGIPVSEPMERYCQELQTNLILTTDEDKMVIAQELLEHFNIVRTYLERLYRAWMAAGDIPEHYRALTRASSSCDTSTVTALIMSISGTLTSCCMGYAADFSGTWTALTTLDTDISMCCSTQQANFVSTWTIINSLLNTPSCGPVTVITQADIDPVNGYTITSSGNYCLAADISYGGSGNAITIASSNVFLTMNNHEILQTAAGTGIQINDNVNDVTVINGTFSSGAQAISLSPNGNGNNNITIKKCLLQDQSVNGIFANGANNDTHTIAYCIFRNTVPINYNDANDLSIHDCVMCNSNNNSAITVSAGSNVSIQDCIIPLTGFGSACCILSEVFNALCNNCIMSLGQAGGIILEECHQSDIQSCLISSAGQNGITFQQSPNCTIANCYIYNNALSGIFAQTLSSNAIINNCIISQNDFDGVSLDNSSQNIIIQNTFLASNPIGIGYGNGTSIYNCTLLNNTAESINLGSSNSPVIHLFVENCIFNTPLNTTQAPGTSTSIVRNNEAFSCANTCFVNGNLSNLFYNNNAFNAGNPAYSVMITNTFNVNTPDPLTGTVGDILRNLTNTN